MNKLAFIIAHAAALFALSTAHAAAEHAPSMGPAAALKASPALIATEPLPLGLECQYGSVRAFAAGDGLTYSLPVWAKGSPVLCGPDAKGRKLSKSELDGAVEAAYKEYRDHRASLQQRP